MKTAVVRAFGLFASVLVAGVAGAQTAQAVEWKVSAGGNGHWYGTIRAANGRWPETAALARQKGGTLVACTSAAEDAFIWSHFTGIQWIGLRRSPSNYSQFVWETGEPFQYSKWRWPEPSGCNPCGESFYVCAEQTGWDDTGYQPNGDASAPGYPGIIEWSADCNADGIVDYGQIVRGELGDVDANGIPDTCERAITGVVPAYGPASGGTQVTMVGYGFAPTSTIAFNGVPAIAVTRVSDTKLLAITPEGTQGPVVVSVNGAGTPDAFFYTANCGSDLDQNGVVDTADLALILLDFGPCSAGAATLEPNVATPFMLREEASAVAPHSR